MSAHVSMRTYVLVFGALLFLTVVTVMMAFVHLGRMNDVVALAIAVTKALLVLLFFMHLRHSSALTRLTVAAGLFWLLTLIALSMSDVLTRGWRLTPEATASAGSAPSSSAAAAAEQEKVAE